MSNFIAARFATVTAVVFAAFLAVTSSVSEAGMIKPIDDASASITLTQANDNTSVPDPQSIALLVMGLAGLVGVRRMQKA